MLSIADRAALRGLLACGLLFLATTTLAQTSTQSPAPGGGAPCYSLLTDPPSGTTVSTGGSATFDLSIESSPRCPTNLDVSYQLFPSSPGLTVLWHAGDRVEVAVGSAAETVSEFQVYAEIRDAQTQELLAEKTRDMVLHVPDGVPSLPDLKIVSFEHPETVYVLDEAAVTAVIQNVGPVPVSAPFNAGLRYGSGSFFPQSCDPLPPGAVCEVEWISYPQGTGTVTFLVCPDPWNTVAESPEQGDCNVGSYEVIAENRPDLVTQPPILETPTPEVGQPITVSVRTSNVGESAAPATRVGLTTPEGYQEKSVPALAVGEGHQSVFTWTPSTPGSALLTGEVDATDLVVESSENNQKSLSLTVAQAGQYPDFFFPVDGLFISPDSPSEGDTVTVTVRMQNRGADHFAPPSPGLRIDGSELSIQTISCGDLPSGAFCEHSFILSAVDGGVQWIRARADYGDWIPESIEENNSRTLHFVVDDAQTDVQCQGTWEITDPSDPTFFQSAPGSLLDECSVYFAENSPTGCWTTEGAEGLVAQWFREPGETCPSSVTVTNPSTGEVWNLEVATP